MHSSNTFIITRLGLYNHVVWVWRLWRDNVVTADAYCCMPAVLLKTLIWNTASPRHKDPPSHTKESLASSTRWQWSVQLNKRWHISTSVTTWLRAK